MLVTLDVSQAPTAWLKEDARQNMYLMLVTLDVS